MINFKSIPFFKILFPYIIGIVCVLNFGTFKQQHICFAIISLLLISTFLFQKYYKPVLYFKKGIYTLCINLFLFIAAFEAAFLFDARNNRDHYSLYVDQHEQNVIGKIVEVPVVTPKHTKLVLSIKCLEQGNQWHYVNGNTIVYVKGTLQTFSVDEEVLIKSKFNYVNEPKNPGEFNYKQYLDNKNIFHSMYVNDGNIVVVPAISNDFSIASFGTRVKANVVAILKESGLSQRAYAICSALLVGYDDEIDGDVMQSFSHSGTLHVLSVSGMHTGVLYSVLVFLFSLFDKHDKYKKWKCFFVILCLIMFVFITGFSPSVSRAALMLTLVLLGKTFYRQGNSYNTLFFSAFLLLLINPYLISDVGFLLSYLAVLGIMYLYPMLDNLYYIKNKIVRWFWSLTLMSVAATVFTLPVCLYYFHQFPVWFVFSNLVIIPLSIGLIALAAALIFCHKIVIIKQCLVWIINGINSLMLWFAELTDNKDYGYIDFISFSKIDLCFFIVFTYLILLVFHTRQHKHVIYLCYSCIAWLVCSVIINYQQTLQKELIVFNVKNKSAYGIRIGQTIYTQFDSINEKELQRHIKPYLLEFDDLNQRPTNNNLFNSAFGSVLHVNKNAKSLGNLPVSYIIVSNNSSIDLSENSSKIKPLVIADCSNSYTFVKKLRKQCALQGISFYSVKESGALQLNLDQ